MSSIRGSVSRRALKDVSVFETEIVKTGRTLSRSGVDVVFSGDGAYTDGRRINLPALDRNKELPERLYAVTRGYVDHESTHVEDTDMELYTEAAKRLGPWGSQALNSLEDMRIDAKRAKEYPGSRFNIQTTADWVCEETLKRYPVIENAEMYQDLKNMATFAITVVGRRDVIGMRGEYLDKVHDAIDDKIKKFVAPYAYAAVQASDTAEVVKLAERLVKEVQGKLPEEDEDDPFEKLREKMGGPSPESGGKGTGKGGASSKDGDTGTEGRIEQFEEDTKGGHEDDSEKATDDGDGDGGSDKEGDGEAEGGAGGESKGEGGDDGHTIEGVPEVLSGTNGEHKGKISPDGGGAGGNGDTFEIDADALNDAVRKRIVDEMMGKEPEITGPAVVDPKLDISGAFGGVLAGEGSYLKPINRGIVYHDTRRKKNKGDPSTQYDKILKPDATKKKAYQERKKEIQGVLAVCQRKLERAMMALNRVDWEPRRLKGRLDRKAFTGVVSRLDPYAYREKGNAQSVNTAVSILVDLSGSMGGEKVRLARQTCIALAESLDRIAGVELEILGFTNLRASVETGSRRKIPEGAAMRSMQLDMFVFKDFEDTLAAARPSIVAIGGTGMGENSDGEAVEEAWIRLMKRDEPKKVLIVLSDGLPACPTVSTSWPVRRLGDPMNYHLKQTVKKVEASGVHVAGVGIKSDAVRKFYKNCVVVNDVNDLGATVFDRLGQMLVGKSFRARNDKAKSA